MSVAIPIKALTIKQPWAWAIAKGHKRIENRNWRTDFRGELAIHAAARRQWSKDGDQFLQDRGLWVPDPNEMIFSAIVAVARVVDCVPLAEVSDDPYAFGPWCWLLADVQRLPEPIRCSGNLSLWRVPDEHRK